MHPPELAIICFFDRHRHTSHGTCFYHITAPKCLSQSGGTYAYSYEVQGHGLTQGSSRSIVFQQIATHGYLGKEGSCFGAGWEGGRERYRAHRAGSKCVCMCMHVKPADRLKQRSSYAIHLLPSFVLLKQHLLMSQNSSSRLCCQAPPTLPFQSWDNKYTLIHLTFYFILWTWDRTHVLMLRKQAWQQLSHLPALILLYKNELKVSLQPCSLDLGPLVGADCLGTPQTSLGWLQLTSLHPSHQISVLTCL